MNSNDYLSLGLVWRSTVSNRKDKQTRRLARKRKAQKPRVQQRSQPSSQEALFKRIQSSEYFKNAEVILNDDRLEKMSDVIHRFAEPLKDENGDVPANMLHFAILVWNASLLPKDEREEAFREIIKALPGKERGVREGALLAIGMLLERKEKYFSDNKRIIIDYDITETKDMLNLNIVSTVPKGYDPEL
jgi:hypothetical protein